MELMGTAEVAKFFKTTKQVICNWVARYPDFPKPYASLSCGRIWRKQDIEKWLPPQDWP